MKKTSHMILLVAVAFSSAYSMSPIDENSRLSKDVSAYIKDVLIHRVDTNEENGTSMHCINSKRECTAKGADITTLGLTPVPIIVNKNYPDSGEKITLIAKMASQNTGGHDVLFLHGFPHCHLSWKNQLAADCLRSKHNLYTLDFRGQGEADKPNPSAPPAAIPPIGQEDTVYRPWQNAAKDIHESIVQLGLNKPVLIAHSAGVIFLNDYLRLYGNSEISGLVLVGGIPDPFNSLATVTQWFSPNVLALAQTGDLVSSDLEKFIPGTQKFVALSSYCMLQPQDLEEVLMYDSVVPGSLRNAIVNHDGLAPIGSGMPSPNDDIWRKVTVPTIVIHGVQDEAILFAAGQHLASVIPTATLHPFEKVGHFPMLEAPKKFNSVLSKFLKSL